MTFFTKLLSVFLFSVLALAAFTTLSTTPVAAADDFVDCAADQGTVSNEQIFNIKCQSQLFGARCFFPTAVKQDGVQDCKYKDSIVGALIDFLIFLGPFVAVLVVLYGGYLYYFAAFGGSADAGRKAITAGVSGLVVLVLISGFKLFILSFSPSRINNNSITIDNLAEKISITILIPIFQILQVGAAAFALVSIIFAGYWYIIGMSQGQQEAIKRGRNGVRNAVIGLVLILLSVTIVALLSNFVNSFKR